MKIRNCIKQIIKKRKSLKVEYGLVAEKYVPVINFCLGKIELRFSCDDFKDFFMIVRGYCLDNSTKIYYKPIFLNKKEREFIYEKFKELLKVHYKIFEKMLFEEQSKIIEKEIKKN